jgi:hypothetical protein
LRNIASGLRSLFQKEHVSQELDPLVAWRYEQFRRLLFDPSLLFIPILTDFGKPPPFSCHSFSRALLRANSCILQDHVFCFPRFSLNPMGPSHKAAARFGSESHSLLCAPRKRGKKKEKIQLCLTYMLSGIALA